ncbi:P2Y purinoceptor 13-like [Xiphias gladius]|uniref:P2Y purinoceptor 13-like n=1 Tax=Xiphias gladius TaxID=8245 RepID=UPI001A9815F9|nr:P2Y purinoceptor 13-like [Xiphias gladius]
MTILDFMMVADNTSHLSSDCAPFSLVTVNVAFSCLFFFLFPISLLLNGVAAWVSLHLRSTTAFIVYLKNLVAADLLMTLTLPPMAASMLPGAALDLKAFACRYSNVIFYCCLYTSIVLLGLISLDRFFKIVRPCGKVLGQNVVFSLVMSTLVWVMLFGSTAIPTIILTNQDPVNTTEDFCMALKSPAGLTLHRVVILAMEILFWLISILIVFCYICITLKVRQSFRNSGSRNIHGKKKTKLRVFLILLVFFVCFVPLHAIRIPFTQYEIFNINACAQMWVVLVQKLVLWVSTTNACLDPLLSIYLCREYRDKMVDMMKARGICLGLYSGEIDNVSQ